jgi:hypothetical protein
MQLDEFLCQGQSQPDAAFLLRAMEPSAWRNSSKMFSWSASEIPGRVSDTDTTNPSFTAAASI